MNTAEKIYFGELNFPQPALDIITQLNEVGVEAYITGGALRDVLLGKDVLDVDIATSMTFEKLKTLFPSEHIMVILPQYYCVKLRYPNVHVDITTYRKEGPYRDHRRPAQVYPASQHEDARRRDFTMNALYYDPRSKHVLDFFGGIEDLLRWGHVKLIRGQESLEEDTLRILRCVRFALQCGLQIEPETMSCIQSASQKVLSVDGDRFRQELSRCLEAAPLYEVLKLFYTCGIFDHFDTKPSEESVVFNFLTAIEEKPPGLNPFRDFLLSCVVLSLHGDFDDALAPWKRLLNVSKKDVRNVRKAFQNRDK
jgi:tRNA nucleotidyltransferase/poly(A) polymerase